jgi:hypothetical protein
MWLGILLVVCAPMLTSTAPAYAAGPELFVSSDQLVTLSGSSPSLRDVVQQLCAAAGVDLRQYDAEDRPFSGNYHDVPLAELLPRLLRSESHAVGLRASAQSSSTRIAWLRVMGASTGKPASLGPMAASPLVSRLASAPLQDAPPAPPEPGPAPAEEKLAPEMAPTIVAAMFRPAMDNISDQEAHKRAVDSIVARLNDNEAAHEALADADPDVIARSLAPYPEARAVFAEIHAGVKDPEIQRRLNAIAAALNKAIASQPKH